MKIVVGHLFPDYLNIYADRGNIAVLERRAAWRGHELEVRALGAADELQAGEHDLYYVGGGQDREQELIAPALAAMGDALRKAVAGGAAALAVCGGYQLFGRSYRDQSGDELPGAGLLPLHTVAGRAADDRRRAARVRARARAAAVAGGLREPRRPHVPRRRRRAARARSRRLRQRRRKRLRRLPGRPGDRHVPPWPPPPPQPVARRLARHAGAGPPHRRGATARTS